MSALRLWLMWLVARWHSVIDVLERGGRYVSSGAIAGPIVELIYARLSSRSNAVGLDRNPTGSDREPDSIHRVESDPTCTRRELPA